MRIPVRVHWNIDLTNDQTYFSDGYNEGAPGFVHPERLLDSVARIEGNSETGEDLDSSSIAF